MNADVSDIEDLVSEALVWDAHAGVFPDPENDLSLLHTWHSAGVSYVSLNVGFDVIDWRTPLRTLAAYRYRLREMADRVSIVRCVDDITAAKRENKLAVSFDIEGANALDGDVAMASAYYDLGIRQMLLAYNLGNAAAGGCHKHPVDAVSCHLNCESGLDPLP